MLVGLGILIYPTTSNWINQLNGSYAIQTFQTRMENADITQERARAVSYNQKLQDRSGDDSGYAADEYEKILDFGGGMMGYIEIPKIRANLPIYHGTGEETLAKGVGHMPQSALPVGGEGNHCVLTGHTGLPSAKLFNDLTELKEEDLFQLHVLNDTLYYRVDQIKVVLPSEAQDLGIIPGKDYCTLVTCTPYGINSHRLLVRGQRVYLDEAMKEEMQEQGKRNDQYLWLIAGAFLILLTVIAIILRMDIASYQ